MAMDDALIDKIDAILPQTQCRQCGFDGCRPYAEAIASGEVDINQCPPGDAAGIQKIADILGVAFKPLNTSHGMPKPKAIAFIDENSCIGCTLCLQACPVDAIVGAPKQMHTIVTDECTGCELCVAPCPVDCISMVPDNVVQMDQAASDRARSRHLYRLERLADDKMRKKPAKKTSASASQPVATTPASRKKQIVQAAIQRAMAARAEMENNKSINPNP